LERETHNAYKKGDSSLGVFEKRDLTLVEKVLKKLRLESKEKIRSEFIVPGIKVPVVLASYVFPQLIYLLTSQDFFLIYDLKKLLKLFEQPISKNNPDCRVSIVLSGGFILYSYTRYVERFLKIRLNRVSLVVHFIIIINHNLESYSSRSNYFGGFCLTRFRICLKLGCSIDLINSNIKL